VGFWGYVALNGQNLKRISLDQWNFQRSVLKVSAQKKTPGLEMFHPGVLKHNLKVED
jgi:hypothetical protein